MSARSRLARLAGSLFRIRTRLLVVNAVVVLVPIVGIEFARLYERELLGALEQDMRHQATLVAAMVSDDLARGVALDDPRHEALLVRAAKETRTRIRVLDPSGHVVVDSHRDGPPEGPEDARSDRMSSGESRSWSNRGPRWPEVARRNEVRAALQGQAWAAYTRVRERAPAVLLFLAHAVHHEGRTVGAVYLVRSTQPVLVGLYRIRSRLIHVLFVALAITVTATLLLAFSISRPLRRLALAARRIARGERDVPVPIGGGGEIEELGEAFATMTERLDARLRYASELAADVAHEFKSPLTSIRGASELLREGAADDPAARARFLGNIELDVARLDRLVSRLLELGRIEATSTEPLDLDVVALTRRVAARCETPDVRVVVEPDAPTLFAKARELDLETALSNLVENAVRFSPSGSSVVVNVSSRDGAATFEVRDRGPGIPEGNRAKIFERFFTTDAARDGTGLGLAIARAVATTHGGSLTVASEVGVGSVFTLRLPIPRRGDPAMRLSSARVRDAG